RISAFELARIPLAPPCLAASAIFPIIKEECSGSSSNAWQDTIKSFGNNIQPLLILSLIDVLKSSLISSKKDKLLRITQHDYNIQSLIIQSLIDVYKSSHIS